MASNHRTLAAVVATLAATTIHAQSAAPLNGRLLASNCFQCHGTNGMGPGFERLAGRSQSDILEELRDFRSGGSTSEIMTRVARGYTDEQLRAIAAYLARVPGQ